MGAAVTAPASAKLAPAPAQYDRTEQQQTRDELDRRDAANYKKRQDIDMDPATVLIMTSPNGTRYAMSVSNAGATVWTAL